MKNLHFLLSNFSFLMDQTTLIEKIIIEIASNLVIFIDLLITHMLCYVLFYLITLRNNEFKEIFFIKCIYLLIKRFIFK